MADLSGDIRLAVDSGEVAVGANSVIASVNNGSSKLVVLAESGEKELHAEIRHLANLAGLKIVIFKGNPVELGAVCGKPFSVSAVSIIDPGNSSILQSDYSDQATKDKKQEHKQVAEEENGKEEKENEEMRKEE
ncbi:MAG: 50S ribosomal protein L30e [Candidatus Micrarchaeaceae archaeon]